MILRSLVIRRLLVMLALLVGSSMPTMNMTAAPRVTPQIVVVERYQFSYYSDDTYTVRVGRARTDCAGNYSWMWGYETEYVLTATEDCPW
jgi:hypothetical protein